MPVSTKKYGSWALIAGAAQGIGKAYVLELARRGFNLVLIDNKEDVLDQLKDHLSTHFEVETLKIGLNLKKRDAHLTILEKTEQLDIGLFIYNAAYGPVKPFWNHQSDELDNYIDINCRTPLQLIYHFGERFKNRKYSGILLMSSIAGFMGESLIAPYAATKGFNTILAEGLHHELKKDNIDVMVCCAGATKTPNYLSTKPQHGLIKPSEHPPELVAKKALKHFGKTSLYIPGRGNRFTIFLLNRLLGRKLGSRIMSKTMEKTYAHVVSNEE